MKKEVITFGDVEIEKRKFHRYKNLVLLEDADIGNRVISNKISLGKKGF